VAKIRWLGALLLLLAPLPAQGAGCAMADADRAWLQQALAEWQATETDVLQLDPAPLPQVIAIDGACTYAIAAGDFAAMTATPHGQTARLPDGSEIPVGPISFAMGGDAFIMSLPSVWRAAGVESEVGLERLMTGVLLHEIMHVRQAGLAKQALAGAAASVGVSDDDLTDDIVQERFGEDRGYVAAYTEERAKLFAAAAAADDATARKLAAEALNLMRDRREGWFDGDNTGFIALDDVFLTMEGMGQLMIYRYFRSPEGGGMDAAAALKSVRRGGKWWSQDEGLALMLVVDRLLPDWQARAFREPDWRADNLLAAAVGDQSEPAAGSIGSPKAGSLSE
jgi:hypothetical protein